MPVEDLLARKFIARPDVKAMQDSSGAYYPKDTKFTREDLQRHVAGTLSLGHYLLSTDDKCKLFAYDIDLVGTRLNRETGEQEPAGEWLDPATGDLIKLDARKAWKNEGHPAKLDLTVQLRCMAEVLARSVERLLGVQVAIAYSGNKGVHVYGFMDEPTIATDVRDAATLVLDNLGWFEPVRGKNFYRCTMGYPNIEIEVFPKQTEIDPDGGYGNLMRLPLGKNKKSGQEAFFLNARAGYGSLVPLDPEKALTQASPWADDA